MSMNNGKNSQWIWMLVFFGLTAGAIVFSVFCLSNSHLMFIQNNKTWLIVTAVASFCLLCGLSIGAILLGKELLVKISISLYVFLLFCLILILIFQKTGFFQLVNNTAGLQNYLEKAGVWMPILYIVVQYLQVIILPIPTLVSTIAGVALFGAFQTLVFSFIGVVLGSITAFYIGRKLGYKAVAWIIGSETLKKWRKKLRGKDNLILTLMFLLPLFPDDVLCFIAGLSSMTNRYFLIMICLTRLVGIAGTCYSFDFIPFNTWWGILIWIGFISIVIYMFIFVYKNMDKIQYFFKNIIRKKNKK